ncbi:MAG TPA: YceI family protein [Candidatus Acidoferrales bacterium]|jgi:polyisoprenoid-binding protein YceI|nr:YceI family protein [Candidatus Acidoferrales bacterium]
MNTAVQAPSQSTQVSRWIIDPAHSAAHFSARHLMISNVRGEFTKVTGSAVIDPLNPAKSNVEVQIDANSINTREPQRDDHLRSADFFDVANFPTLSFRSTRIEAKGAEELKLTGDLTIHGVTKEVTFDVEGPTPEIKDPWGNVRAGITAATKISRKEFGLAFNALTDTGGVVVGDEVKITLEAELIRQADAA